VRALVRPDDPWRSAACSGRGEEIDVASGEGVGELLAGGDVELLVDVGQASFHGSSGDEQLLRDVAVGETGGGQLGDASLARG
jgi:hypothetical protein